MTPRERIDQVHLPEYYKINTNGTRLMTYAFGSHNYRLAIGQSDVDTKTLILPSFNDVVLGKKVENKIYTISNNEHFEVLDIRTYFNLLRQQNFNAIEMLITSYYNCSTDFYGYFTDLLSNKNSIARYNEYRFLRGLYGRINSYIKAIEQSKDNSYKMLKALSMAYYLARFAIQYAEGDSLENCFNHSHVDTCRKIKLGNITSDAIERGYNNLLKWLEQPLYEKFPNKNDAVIDEFFDYIVIRLVKQEL